MDRKVLPGSPLSGHAGSVDAMSQRLEVMLTSRRPDGTWTWRAAGARQPKGVLEDGLLPADAAVGDVLRVEADVSVDGIAVRQVLPTKTERPPSSPRLEHLGSKRFTEGVTMAPNLARKAADRTESPRDGRRRKGGGGRPREGGRPGRDGSGPRGGRDRPPRAPRLRPDNNYRDAWLETLSSDERAIAERLANEGIRAVRQALQSEDEPAEGQEAGRAGDAGDARLAVVEKLFSAYRVVDWRDRAEAARKVTDEVDLRDLRSVVAGIPAKCPDDEARSLADELRGKLAARVDREHSAWIADLGSLLRKGRLVTALRVSQRPPKAGTPLPESLAGSLQEGVKSQLNNGAEDDLWVRMLEAAAQSPIRLVLVAQEVPAGALRASPAHSAPLRGAPPGTPRPVRGSTSTLRQRLQSRSQPPSQCLRRRPNRSLPQSRDLRRSPRRLPNRSPPRRSRWRTRPRRPSRPLRPPRPQASRSRTPMRARNSLSPAVRSRTSSSSRGTQRASAASSPATGG